LGDRDGLRVPVAYDLARLARGGDGDVALSRQHLAHGQGCVPLSATIPKRTSLTSAPRLLYGPEPCSVSPSCSPPSVPSDTSRSRRGPRGRWSRCRCCRASRWFASAPRSSTFSRW